VEIISTTAPYPAENNAQEDLSKAPEDIKQSSKRSIANTPAELHVNTNAALFTRALLLLRKNMLIP